MGGQPKTGMDNFKEGWTTYTGMDSLKQEWTTLNKDGQTYNRGEHL